VSSEKWYAESQKLWVHGMQAAEDAIMAEMAEVKAGMERRHKREKRKKLEQKKKARVRAAQAVLGGSPTPAHLAPFCHLTFIQGLVYLLQHFLCQQHCIGAWIYNQLALTEPVLKLLLPAQPTLLAGTTAESKTVSETLPFMNTIVIPPYTYHYHLS